jgi:acyl-CoA reductase-like NAD-dependent aldehyde dehydrogenase
MEFVPHVIDGQETESIFGGAGHAERGALLHRFADLIEANAEMLALADSTDMGKPVSDARIRTLLI